MTYRVCLLCLLPLYIWGQTIRPSKAPGRYAAPFSLSLQAPGNATLHYTLDGSPPSVAAPVFTNGLWLTTNSVVRVQAFLPDGSPLEEGFIGTYLIGQPATDFGIAVLTADPDSVAQLYALYNEDYTVTAWLEWLEPGIDTVVLSQWVEIEIQGGASSAQAQKSIEIAAKKALGKDRMNWSFFPQLPFNQYERLVLRNGGQDWMVTQCRDEFATSLADDLAAWKGILEPLNLQLQAWRPSVLYLNGRYQGIHTLRERMNRFYVQQHYELKKHEFDMIERFNTTVAGDALAWDSLQLWLATHSCANDDVFQYLSSQVNIDHFIDYCLFQVFIDNQDWPGNNNRRWRQRSADGQWQWLCYDLDLTMGLLQLANNGWNTGDATADALARLLDGTQVNLPNPDWSTLLFRRCWENAQFRRAFANRSADCLNTIFQPDHLNTQLDNIRDLYRPEIGRHYERWWFADYTALWLDNIETLRKFCSKRAAQVFQHYKSALGESEKLGTVRVDVFPPNAGTVRVNSIHLTNQHLPWVGKYFTTQTIDLEASAAPGWHFVGWKEIDNWPVARLETSLTAGNNYRTAVFSSNTEQPPTREHAGFWLSPNPVQDQLTITLMDSIKWNSGDFRVVDALGRTMAVRPQLTDQPDIITLNMSTLPAGCYWVWLGKGMAQPVVKW